MFRNLRISTKLFSALFFIIGLLGTVAIVALVKMGSINYLDDRITHEVQPLLDTARDLQHNVELYTRILQRPNMVASQGSNRELFKYYVRLRRQLANIVRLAEDYSQPNKQLLSERAKYAEAQLIHPDDADSESPENIKMRCDSLQGLVHQIGITSEVIRQDARHKAARASRAATIFTVVSFLVAAIIGTMLGTGIGQSIASPLLRITRAARNVEAGDFSQKVEWESSDEIGVLAASFNQMVSKIEARIALDEVTMNMLSSLELDEVSSVLCEALVEAFDAEFARIWLMGEGDLCEECLYADVCGDRTQCLHLKVSRGAYAQNLDYLRIPIGGLRVGRMVENRQPILINDVEHDPILHNRDWHYQKGITCFAGYPLIYGDEVIGAIALFRRKTMNPNEFDMLAAFAYQGTIAIQNASLLQEIRALNETLEHKVHQRTAELEIANQQLQRADRLKSEFLATMSHELRTPLNSVIGFAEILQDEICGELNEEQKEFVQDIQDSGQHLLTMINDILDLSKIEAGRMELNFEEFSIHQALQEVHAIIMGMANKKRIHPRFEVVPREFDIVADKVKFKQIMYNLLSNAVKFTPEGGNITTRAEILPTEVQVSVRDTGIGIRPEDRDTLFQSFQQLDSSYSREYQGTGLGLALTKRLVELHNGTIWLESEHGKGSRFTFSLPIQVAERQSQDARMEQVALQVNSDQSAEKQTILVAEDNPQAARLLAVYLREAGYNTVLARDGKEAILMAQSVQPFAITLDIMLPEKDGWEVLKELKTIPDLDTIPVIIISIVDEQEIGLGLGAVDYLVKPIQKEDLIEALDRLHLQSSSHTPPGRILVVDDQPKTVKWMQTVLEAEGYEVIPAFDGEEGILHIQHEPPDLIILDLMMPKVSGFDVIDFLKGDPQYSAIPVIICTAKDLTPQDKQLLNGNIQSIIRKSGDIRTELLDTIHHIGSSIAGNQ